jgi:hypothetical protein
MNLNTAAIVEDAHVDRVLRPAATMGDRHARAVGAVDGTGMDAAPRVGLIDPLAFNPTHGRAFAQVCTVDDDSERRGFDGGLASTGDAERQTAVGAGDRKRHPAVGTLEGHGRRLLVVVSPTLCGTS